MVDDICGLGDDNSFKTASTSSCSKIVLTDPLKLFINKCKNDNNLPFLKKSYVFLILKLKKKIKFNSNPLSFFYNVCIFYL